MSTMLVACVMVGLQTRHLQTKMRPNSFHLATIQRSIMFGMLRAQIVHTAKQIKRMCRQHIELSSVKYACKPSKEVSLVLF